MIISSWIILMVYASIGVFYYPFDNFAFEKL